MTCSPGKILIVSCFCLWDRTGNRDNCNSYTVLTKIVFPHLFPCSGVLRRNVVVTAEARVHSRNMDHLFHKMTTPPHLIVDPRRRSTVVIVTRTFLLPLPQVCPHPPFLAHPTRKKKVTMMMIRAQCVPGSQGNQFDLECQENIRVPPQGRAS